MNEKGMTPLIAIILLMVMTIAAGAGAYYWLTNMQERTQMTIEHQHGELVRESTASLAIISHYFNSSEEVLELDIQNTGKVSVNMRSVRIVGMLQDLNGNAVCAAGNLNSTNFYCSPSVCTGAIFPNAIKRIKVNVSECGTLNAGEMYYYEFMFEKGAPISGYFSK